MQRCRREWRCERPSSASGSLRPPSSLPPSPISHLSLTHTLARSLSARLPAREACIRLRARGSTHTIPSPSAGPAAPHRPARSPSPARGLGCPCSCAAPPLPLSLSPKLEHGRCCQQRRRTAFTASRDLYTGKRHEAISISVHPSTSAKSPKSVVVVPWPQHSLDLILIYTRQSDCAVLVSCTPHPPSTIHCGADLGIGVHPPQKQERAALEVVCP